MSKSFEGWFDFLSYLKLSGTKNFKSIILDSTANLSFRLIMDILKESKNIDLYLDNDATGKKYTTSVIKIAQLYRYCQENGLTTNWDLNGLKGSRNKIGKLINNLGIKPFEAKGIFKIKSDVSDQRIHFREFEDLNDNLIVNF
ncbi:toprim domain-containing protein [Algoriphagus pacificus]|uniref:Toprim domain-containing protein n=1 Tax=Algoriphagus pacificus TaxID=2811234 RepID=A0ABS3CKL4_9BACT|nr:toprim domain-containing protein [Algoriphagus pacificus]MBN7817638.1 toprim domain-containing protein [Algoriphagus pacificus]